MWGDILTALGDASLRSPNDLLDALERHRVGDKVTLTVERDQQPQKLQVRLEAAE